ncbi:hypothetical protein [Domibacillus iocasae]|uniref:Uncharacterized protein n=1 Tax=Domibacillus iocasae TaxID=1714016 RepID=A0A1E7DT09_9BACI|nr:hypothetical protein [Domibacillus iocasae]OES46214.1 hypothetical protein BA724_15305 [Domibacillus iocasae]
MTAIGLLKTMFDFYEAILLLTIALYPAQNNFGAACNVPGNDVITLAVASLTKKDTATSVKRNGFSF